jgi:arginase
MTVGALLLVRGGASQAKSSDISLILAPSNLGLRPENGHQPGTWRAPQALMDAGLAAALNPAEIIPLERPTYQFEAQSGTRIRNGQTLRAFLLQLSGKVRGAMDARRFPVVIGGDCGILLGALYGSRLAGGRGLVHIDGHSDFAHPGNYDAKSRLGAVAGMDLALATGRGEPLMTTWPEVGTPLAQDVDTIQVGERHNGPTPDLMPYNGDVARSEITQFTVQQVLAEGIEPAVRKVIARLEARGLDKVWMHVDLDVLDEAVMPAVDSPGTPGLNFEQLSALVGALCASGRIVGANFTIYDPERDPEKRYAQPLVRCIADGVRERSPLGIGK